jgi:hypothetical protein
MPFYWIIFILILGSMMAIIIAGQYAVVLKHQFDKDYKPRFIVNEPEVYVIGCLGGGIGLLISYLAFEDIRKNDSLNSRRYLWISLASIVLQALVIWLLSYYQIITYTL